MNNNELVIYLKLLGWIIEKIYDKQNQEYIVIKNYSIPIGSLKDRKCDIAFLSSNSIPYVFPSAIHTKPVLLSMNTNGVQASLLGSDWQYWSRTLSNGNHTPKNIVTHINTIFRDVKDES